MSTLVPFHAIGSSFIWVAYYSSFLYLNVIITLSGIGDGDSNLHYQLVGCCIVGHKKNQHVDGGRVTGLIRDFHLSLPTIQKACQAEYSILLQVCHYGTSCIPAITNLCAEQ